MYLFVQRTTKKNFSYYDKTNSEGFKSELLICDVWCEASRTKSDTFVEDVNDWEEMVM